jgi:hypothetical protein
MSIEAIQNDIVALKGMIRAAIADVEYRDDNRIAALLEELNIAVDDLNDAGGDDGHYDLDWFASHPLKKARR